MLPRECRRDCLVIHNAGVRHAKPGDAGDMRFDRAHRVASQPRDIAETVRGTATGQLIERGNLARAGRDHQLAAALVRNAMF